MIAYKRHEVQKQSNATWTVSSLLVPLRYMGYYNEQSKKHGSRAKYLRYLLGAYGPLVRLYQKRMADMKEDKWKNYYQEPGQELQKSNFRPAPEIWEQLRNIATGFGVSMCYLFIFLMELEMHKVCPSVFELNANEYDSKDEDWHAWIQQMRQLAGRNRRKTNFSVKFISNVKFFCSRRVDFGPMKLHRRLKLSI